MAVLPKVKLMADILDETSKKKTKKEKLDHLRLHHSPQFHWLMNFTFHPGIIFELPESDPPFQKSPVVGVSEGMLYNLIKKIPLLVKGGPGSHLPNAKREMFYIQLLEAVDPKEAELLLEVKNKKLPYKGITAKLIEEAYGSIDPKSPDCICPCKNGGFTL